MLKTFTKEQHKAELEEKNKTFKNVANAYLKGSSFDSVHLDQFLSSEYGNKNQLYQYHEKSKEDQPPISHQKQSMAFPQPVQTNVRYKINN